MRRSIRIFTILGIPIEINYTWLVIFGLITWTLAQGYFPSTLPGFTPLAYWTMSIIAALLLFASLLLHELSHSYIAKINNLPIKGITLFIFGGVAHMTKEPDDPQTEFKMAIAGPACSFSLSLIFWLLTTYLYRLGAYFPMVAIFNYLFIINLMVGIFNLMPGFPLDGGRVLRASLWAYYNDQKKATQIASNFGKGFAYLLMALGLAFLFGGSVLNGIWFIFIGFFLYEAAETSYQQVMIKDFLVGVKVKNIMSREVITVDSALNLTALVENYFFRYRHASFPVVSEGKVIGLVTFHEVKNVPRELWDTTPTHKVMTPISEDLIISEGSEIVEALAKIAKSGLGRVLVIEGGKLIGILSQRDILRLFELEAEIGRPNLAV
jgi:Zn-dependent protease/CBS domain-containing protein